MTAHDPALRHALQAMLQDPTYREAWESRPWVEDQLRLVLWTDELRTLLQVLAVRWARQQDSDGLMALTLRKALGQALTEEEQTILADPVRKARIQQAVYSRLEREISMVPEMTEEVTHAADIPSAFEDALATVARDMQKFPYWHPDKGDDNPHTIALTYVKTERVIPLPDGSYEVRGEDGVYTIARGSCECKSHRYGRNSKWCKHLMGAKMHQEATALVAQRAVERSEASTQEPALSLPPTTAEERLATPAWSPGSAAAWLSEEPREPEQETASRPEDTDAALRETALRNRVQAALTPAAEAPVQASQDGSTLEEVTMPLGRAEDGLESTILSEDDWVLMGDPDALLDETSTVKTPITTPPPEETPVQTTAVSAMPLNLTPVISGDPPSTPVQVPTAWPAPCSVGDQVPTSCYLSQDRIERSAAMDQLIPALARAQAAMKNPGFDSTNPTFHSRYPSLKAVRAAVLPPLAAEGIALTQLVTTEGATVLCTTVLWHGNQYLSATLRLPATKRPLRHGVVPEGEPDSQEFGSAAAYARRYGLMAICCVAGDDDDDAETVSHRDGLMGPGLKTSAPPSTPRGGTPLTDEQSKQWAEIRRVLGVLGFRGGSTEDYKPEVRRRTGVELVPANFAAILTKLEALGKDEEDIPL